MSSKALLCTIRYYYKVLIKHRADYVYYTRLSYALNHHTGDLLVYKNDLLPYYLAYCHFLGALGFMPSVYIILFIILGIYLSPCILHRRFYNTLISHRRPPRL